MFGYLAAESFRPKKMPENVEPFREPTDGTLRYRPWGAVPADPFRDDEVREHQLIIDAEFQKLFDMPPEGTPAAFAQMLSDDQMSGEARRKMKNYEGYHDWLDLREPVGIELDAKIEYLTRGRAMFGEALDFGLETSVMHFEGGKVTHPYKQRLEYVELFRQEAEEAIEARGGIVYPKVQPYHSISIIPDIEYLENGGHLINGFIVKYKRNFGSLELPNHKGVLHLTERQLAGFRVDQESGFSQGVIQRMQCTPISMTHGWQEKYVKYIVDTGARGFIEKAVQTDSVEDYLVPISTTLYGHKELYTPGQRLAKKVLRPTEDNGIAYFGPAHAHSKVPNLITDRQ